MIKVNQLKLMVYPARKTSIGRKTEILIRYGSKKLVSLGDTNRSFFRPGWRTCDLVDADYIIDFRKNQLPFPENSLDAIHSSHLIEHISTDAGLKLFREIFRCLKPRGIFRVSTPDMSLLIAQYKKENWRFFLQADGSDILQRICKGYLPPESILMHNRLIGWFASYSGRLDTGGGPIADKDIVDKNLRNLSRYEFRDWCVSLLEPQRVYAHVHLYDYEELFNALESVGFSTIKKVKYGESISPYMVNPVIDQPKHKIYSLYVEVIK